MIAPTPVPTPARLLPPSGAPRAVARFAGTQRRDLRACAGRTLTVYDTAGQGLTYGLDSATPPSPRLQRNELGADTSFNTVT